jgi:hypothetical protein
VRTDTRHTQYENAQKKNGKGLADLKAQAETVVQFLRSTVNMAVSLTK